MKHTYSVRRPQGSGRKRWADAYPRHTATSITASSMSIRRSPKRSTARPSWGLMMTPRIAPTMASLANVSGFWSNTLTSTHGANVRNTCFRAPKSTERMYRSP